MSNDPYAGLQPVFSQQLQALINASNGRLYLNSGYRSVEEQQRLWDAAVAKYGSPEAARKWVAPPGHSNHNKGMAGDLGGDLELAHQLAPQFGLVFPMDYEPWHVELASTRDGASQQAYSTAPAGAQYPKEADWSLSPDKLAGSLAESLLGAGMSSAELTNVSASAAAATGDTSSGTGTYTPGGGAFGGVESQKWATDFLTRLGMPVTPENLRAVTAWQRAESGGGGGRFNPLNTTQGGFAGETNYNSVGVKNYQSYDDGLNANVKVINNGRYQPILDALKQGNNAMSVAQAISQTPWGTGALVEKILGGG